MTVQPSPAPPSTFRDFERGGWEAIPASYDDGFASLTPQAAAPLLDAAGAESGTDVLDVATGPGYLAEAAAGRGARVVGVDFSAAMIERARLRHPGIDFQTGDAEALPFADGSFDAVVMSFGLLHLERPERALAESYRVLRSSGRLAFTVWAPPDEAVGFGIVLRAVAEHGTLDVPLPPGPPFFRFSEPEECIAALRTAGFAEASVTRVPQVWRLASPDALYEIMAHGTVRTAGLLGAQPGPARGMIRAAIRQEAAQYQNDGVVELPMPAVLASARKP